MIIIYHRQLSIYTRIIHKVYVFTRWIFACRQVQMAESCDNNIGGLAGSSDDSSSSCSDPLTTPPHRHKKPSTSTRAHTLEVRKSGRKKGRKPETSRASSEPSTDSDSPDSDRVVSKKHKIKKQHRKQSTGSHVHTDIFQKHYSDLVSLVQHCTVSIANRAYSKYMISRDVLCKVTNSQDSQASVLMFAIGDLLKVSPHKINKLVRCLEEEPSLHSVTKKMRSKPCLLRLYRRKGQSMWNCTIILCVHVQCFHFTCHLLLYAIGICSILSYLQAYEPIIKLYLNVWISASAADPGAWKNPMCYFKHHELRGTRARVPMSSSLACPDPLPTAAS